MWLCRCSCGKEISVRAIGLKNRTTVSCGCAKRRRLKKHGLSGSRIDIIYRGMKQRCYDRSASNYGNYGGRGIKICDEWLNNKCKFFTWAYQNGYADDLSIDRIDVNGNYEPSNCRWVNSKVQSNNRRNSRLLTFRGKSLTMQEWSNITGVPYQTLYSRLRAGWSVKDILLKSNISNC